jgi:hypothetical protein
MLRQPERPRRLHIGETLATVFFGHTVAVRPVCERKADGKTKTRESASNAVRSQIAPIRSQIKSIRSQMAVYSFTNGLRPFTIPRVSSYAGPLAPRVLVLRPRRARLRCVNVIETQFRLTAGQHACMFG